jgi:hypothetical protein
MLLSGRGFCFVAGRGLDKVGCCGWCGETWKLAVALVARRNATEGVPYSALMHWRQAMSSPHYDANEVDQLLLNARLRDELEPFLDESVHILDCRRLPTDAENEFLAQMLAWERAPVLPISKWFEPELALPPPEKLSDAQLHELLWQTIERLYSQRIVLDFTEHLTDRQLYCLIARDILPSPEKKLALPRNYLHWHFLDVEAQPETWLTYYASDEERQTWAEESGQRPPPRRSPPYPRRMPRRPA